MRTHAVTALLLLAGAPTGALASDGGPITLSISRALTPVTVVADDTPASDADQAATLDNPSLSLTTGAADATDPDQHAHAAHAAGDSFAPREGTAVLGVSGFDAPRSDPLDELLRSERSPLELAPSLRIEFSRPTQLRDGGVSGDAGALRPDRLSAFADDRGDIDLYNVAFRWDAVSRGPITLSLMGGVQAVQANIVGRVGEYDSDGNLVSSRLDDAQGVAPVPVVGGGVRWDVSEKFFIAGAAQTHTIPDGASLLDLTAQTGLDLSPTVGLRAGYQYLRTTVQVQDLDASLSVSGLFARLEIAF